MLILSNNYNFIKEKLFENKTKNRYLTQKSNIYFCILKGRILIKSVGYKSKDKKSRTKKDGLEY